MKTVSPLKTHLAFHHPAEFIAAESLSETTVSVGSVDWFVKALKKVPTLLVDSDLGQEDWGVRIEINRQDVAFWAGLNLYGEQRAKEGWRWLVFFKKETSWFSWFSRSSNHDTVLQSILADFQEALAQDPEFNNIKWYTAAEWNAGPE